MKRVFQIFSLAVGLSLIGCSDDGNGDGGDADTGTDSTPSATDGDTDADTDADTDTDADADSDVGGNVDPLIGCAVFPADNPWNLDISDYPVHENSDAFIQSIGANTGLHMDFGTVWNGAPNGIPYVVVDSATTRVQVAFDYADESDDGPYPIPANPPIEGGPDGGGDRHILMIDRDECILYELFYAWPPEGGGDTWSAGSGAIFDLSSNQLRPQYWTSADAAGLPIFPGLVRYEEAVTEGIIDHALRFTVSTSQQAFIPPATHYASSNTSPNTPPMGLRVRLKSNYDIGGFSPEIQVIAQAMKTYGMIVADNGSDWYVSGAPNDNWNDDHLHELDVIEGSDFEVVYTGDPVN